MAKLDLIIKQFALERVLPTQYNFIPEEEDTPVSYSSLLGTPVYSALEIKAGTYRDQNGDQISYPGLFLDGVLMTVNRSKNIVTTAVQGREGTVKEFIATGDYFISIMGVITSPYAKVYPQALVNDLIAITNVTDSVQVTSRFLQQFGIYEMVIQSESFPQRAGYYNTQAFALECISDKPLELKLSQRETNQ